MSELALALGTDRPLNRGVYAALRGAILEGRVPPGRRLPSSRALADTLQVSRNTVLFAFEQLAAEGYVESRHGAGTFVVPTLRVRAPAKRRAKAVQLRLSTLGARLERGVPRSERAEDEPAAPVPYDLRSVGPGHDAQTLDAWARLLARRARGRQGELSRRQPSGGPPALREALGAYLARARGLECTPDQVVVTQGSHQAIDMCIRLLVDSGDRVVLEEPHYTGYASCLAACGARVAHIPVDAEGLQVERLDGIADARIACVTPSHQFPAGGVMPLTRRLRLLDWAATNRTAVVEDDYDGEFRHEGRPIECLHSLDRDGLVIYLGSASRILFPALRIGWAVVPGPLVDAFLRLRAVTSSDTAGIEQQAFADFVREGLLERHVRRVRKRLAGRRAALLDSLWRELGRRAEVAGASAGIHVLVRLRDLPATAFGSLREACLARGVAIYSAGPSYAEPPRHMELLVGYASLAEEEIGVAVAKLREALDCLDSD